MVLPCPSVSFRPELVRSAVEAAGRVEVHAVVSPTEPSRKVGDRHHLYDGHPEGFQLRQFGGSRGPGALGGERADVHFVGNLPLGADTRPVRVRSMKRPRVDDG